MPPKSASSQRPRDAAGVGSGDAARGDASAIHVEKKDRGPPLMPSKRPNPMREERAGVQRPPSRVIAATVPALAAPPPLVRSRLLHEQRPAVSRLSYGLALDRAAPAPSAGDAGANKSATTPLSTLPSAPELDTQWLTLRRLQGRYIGGPHGDLLHADGVGSGVTEPFFFSAVRPGTSANKRASEWFGRTVAAQLAPTDVLFRTEAQLKAVAAARAAAAAAAASSANAGSERMDASAGATSGRGAGSTAAAAASAAAAAAAAVAQPKRKKNPYPTTLQEFVATVFGGPQAIYTGTPSLVAEFHAQCFPIVRADGTVDIATCSHKVIAAMAPATADAGDVAALWLEMEASAAANAAAAAAAAGADGRSATAITRDGDASETESNPTPQRGQSIASGATSPTAGDRGAAGAQWAGVGGTSAGSVTSGSVAGGAASPPGTIAYATLLAAVRRLLTDPRFVDAAFDLCDVCGQGVVYREAAKRAIAQMTGVATPATVRQQQLVAAAASATVTGAALNATVGGGGGSAAIGRVSPDREPPGAVSAAAGTLSVSAALSAAAAAVSAATTSKPASPAAATGGPRTARQLHAALVQERADYDAMRRRPDPSLAEFVASVVAASTLGPEAPVRRPAPPPGRFWVTANQRPPAPVVASPHFQFPIATALLRALSHISGFEEQRSLFPKGGKKPKRGATLPSMRQEHITRAEFGDIFACDPHVATPFLPFLMRCAVADAPAPPEIASPEAAASARRTGAMRG
jgi:hypothetical protein